jgi:hypothetical protein
MILDERNEFCDATSVALTAGASWQNIGDVIDVGLAARDIGNGEPVYLVVTVDTGINAAGAGSIAFRMASDDSGTIHASTSTVHAVSPTLTTSTTSGDAPSGALRAGQVLWVTALPMEGNVYERYVGIQTLVSTQDTSAGKVNVFLTRDVARWKAYDAPFQG